MEHESQNNDITESNFGIKKSKLLDKVKVQRQDKLKFCNVAVEIMTKSQNKKKQQLKILK